MKTEIKYIWSNLAIHPGESLAEEMEFRGMSVDELADLTDQSPDLILAIMQGKKPITPTFAVALGSSIEIPAQFWINLQNKYDVTLAHNELTAREGPIHACHMGEGCPTRQTYNDDDEGEGDDKVEFPYDALPSPSSILREEGE